MKSFVIAGKAREVFALLRAKEKYEKERKGRDESRSENRPSAQDHS